MNEIKTTTKKINSLFYRLYSITEKMTTQTLIQIRTAKIKKKKKKTAHAYFEHRIFSKFFGGKICHI